ncbi:MAG TPA: hypothetical protein VFC51_14935, partial [Chloroflexota bacterium]|nr:hypothetical protein [Chloroflexota bacterium]
MVRPDDADDHGRRSEAAFAPVLYLALVTLVGTSLAIVLIVSYRGAIAFATPTRYSGTFLNREFFADYSPDAGRTTDYAVIAPDEESGAPRVSFISVSHRLGPVRPEVLSEAASDQRAIDNALRDTEDRSPVFATTDEIAGRATDLQQAHRAPQSTTGTPVAVARLLDATAVRPRPTASSTGLAVPIAGTPRAQPTLPFEEQASRPTTAAALPGSAEAPSATPTSPPRP